MGMKVFGAHYNCRTDSCEGGGLEMVEGVTDLLSVVGGVGEHGGHVKHQLVVLVGGVERVCASGVRWNTEQDPSFKVSDFLTTGRYIR